MFEQGIDYLFNEVSLYSKETFSVFELKDNKYEYNKEEFFRFLYYIGIKQEKLITYCHKCKKEFPFEVDLELFEFEFYMIDKTRTTCMTVTKGDSFDVGKVIIRDGSIVGKKPPYNIDDLIDNKIWYIEYFFSCTNTRFHKYMMMISIELKDGRFIVKK